MTRIRSRSLGRRGFTLIELLVVIAIIAILVSLTAAAVMKVLWKIPEVQTRTEISQLEASLAAFGTDYGLSDPPPSAIILKEDLQYNMGNALEARSFNFLKQAFGKNLGAGTASAATGGLPFVDWNGDGAFQKTTAGFNGWTLEGEQCLIFYTGGIPSLVGSTPAPLGFSTNNNNPAMPGGKRNGPYMQSFKTNRLVQAASGFYVYLDAWEAKAGPKPYAYFSSSGIANSGYLLNGGLDCQTIGAAAYKDAAGHFMNPSKYQIISAGQDGVFVTPSPPGPPVGVWNPTAGATGNDADNQVNFSSKLLGAPQQ